MPNAGFLPAVSRQAAAGGGVNVACRGAAFHQLGRRIRGYEELSVAATQYLQDGKLHHWAPADAASSIAGHVATPLAHMAIGECRTTGTLTHTVHERHCRPSRQTFDKCLQRLFPPIRTSATDRHGSKVSRRVRDEVAALYWKTQPANVLLD
jgi:hypothetical protein